MIPEKFNANAAAASAHTIDVMSDDKRTKSGINEGGGRSKVSQQLIEDMKEEM